jgi:hypothetical protein
MGSIWPANGVRRLDEAMSDLAQAPPQEETTLSIGKMNPSLWIVPLRRRHAGSRDSADGNWVDARVTIHAGMFEGDYAACLRSDEMAAFRRELQALLAGESNIAGYHSLEEWLGIDVTGAQLGHYRATCTARDDLGSPNQLAFSIETDRLDIESLIQAIEGWLRYLPVIGRD